MERDGDFAPPPDQGQPTGQPELTPPPAQPWQPAPPELLGQPSRPAQSAYPPAGGYTERPANFAPTPEQAAYPPTPPIPETPGMGYGAQYSQQTPTVQGWGAGGYAPPSTPLGGYGPPGYGPPPGYQPVYQPPAPQPQRKSNSGVWMAVGALGLVVVLLLLFVAPGLALTHNNGSNGGNQTNQQGSTSQATDTPFATDTPYPTDTPYATDTPYPTDTPVPAPGFPFQNNSVNMQMGTSYVDGSPPQITGQTSDFSSTDTYALLLDVGPNTLGVTQVNFQLWQRVTETTGNVLLSQAQSVQSSWTYVLWHDNVSHLMGSEPAGQYQIYITNSANQYIGYFDFNYHG